ncbi:Ig-like domain-containing protein [Paenibacillus sp. sgz302251]|uniref:Ig-like domain-containing protein n=1 Tax=Paenibacillus sp. sgz302251 TaxID=3414493 RepID=UPI003C7E22C4
MIRTRKLSLFMAVMLLLQISLTGWSWSPQQALAAPAGPVLVSLSPADDLTNVPITADLKMTFDENILKGSSSTNINIYDYATSNLVESINIGSNRVTIDSSQRVVTINPTNNFALNTNYYVLVDAGAYTNASNGAGYVGINSASSWNFRTVAELDIAKPSHTQIIPTTAGVPITASITITFNEPVFVASGNILISSAEDTRSISVTSSAVQGSGTTQIVIQPPAAFQPNTAYTVNIPSTAFQDTAGNLYNGTLWTFTTDAAPVNAVDFAPADNATSVPVNSTFTISFDKNVQARAGKFIEIRRISNNTTFERFDATNSRIQVTNNTVTITPSSHLEANTAYYILVHAGAFTMPDPQGDQWYHGIAGASIWNFSTDPGNENVPPLVTALSPANNGAAANLNALLQLTFNEPVFPSSGNIEIRNASNHTVFRTIPITSERVTGGGTYQITIDANKAISGEEAKPFVNNTKYYVTIGNRAIRDAAGNFYAGMSANLNWNFNVTQDTVRPALTSLSPVNNESTVATNTTFVAAFSEAIRITSLGAVRIHQAGIGAPAPLIANLSIDPADNKRLFITAPAGTLHRATSYYIYIEENAIMDLAGNMFAGILNEYQWTFKTVGSDVTPPAVSRIESIGATIKITYDEPLNTGLWPSPGSYYVTVNGAPRSVTNAHITGESVILALSSPIVSGQDVKLSYSKPSPGLVQDLTGNEAAGLTNVGVGNAQDTIPPVIASSSVSGSMITLTFSEELTRVNSYAYTQFSVNVGGVYYSGTSISSSGAVLKLTINGTIQNGQSVILHYSPGAYPLRDAAGNNVTAVSGLNLSGSVDTRGPALQSISASGLTITLKYDENINPQSLPSASQYSVLVDNTLRAVSQVRITGDTVVLALTTNVLTGQDVKVTYIAGASMVTDALGNAAASFHSVSANGGGPTQSGLLQGVIVKGSTVTLTFSEMVSAASNPSPSLFVVRLNDSVKVVTRVEVSGSKVTLTLASPAGVGERANVSYYSNSAGLKTTGGRLINDFTNVNAANQTTLLDSLTGDYEAADGSGVGMKTSTASTSTDVSPSGATATRYVVMNDKILSAYQTARSAGLANPRVVFKVPSHERAAIVAIPVLALDMANRQGGNAVFAVQYGDVAYELPLSVINYQEVSALLGGSGIANQLLIEIDQGSSADTSSLTMLLKSANAQVIAGPVDFEVSATNGTTEKAINKFNHYVTRTIQTSSMVDPAQTAVVWYDSQTNALSYAPTELSTSSGKTTATFKRQGNSAYALVRNSSSFTDISKHWAADAILTMSRKFIVEGRTATRFEPGAAITRGEFATYIAKGLGLAGDKTSAAKFKDVNTSTAMGAYIGAASSAGIVVGNTDGTFKPNSSITRQEMAVMMMRAAKMAGVSADLPQSTASYLQKFTDRSRISAWAQADVAKAVHLGVIGGKTASTMSPLTNATRAEGTLMLMRLLQKAKFITP